MTNICKLKLSFMKLGSSGIALSLQKHLLSESGERRC